VAAAGPRSLSNPAAYRSTGLSAAGFAATLVSLKLDAPIGLTHFSLSGGAGRALIGIGVVLLIFVYWTLKG
jgi:hypothetical protein